MLNIFTCFMLLNLFLIGLISMCLRKYAVMLPKSAATTISLAVFLKENAR